MSRIAKFIQRHPGKAMIVLAVIWGLGGWIAPAEAEEIEGNPSGAVEVDGQRGPSPSLWINTGGFSKHFEDNGRNETNLGLGAEYRFRDDLSAMAGYHKNSLNLRTAYAAVNYQPLEIGPLKVGASIGVMTGYPQKNNGGGFFAALPMVTYEGKTFGANVGVIPNIPSQHVEGAFVLQLKFRAF